MKFLHAFKSNDPLLLAAKLIVGFGIGIMIFALVMIGLGLGALATVERATIAAELAKVGFDPVFGARPLKRAIQQRIENPLSKALLAGQFPPKSAIRVTVDPIKDPGVFHFEREEASSAPAEN